MPGSSKMKTSAYDRYVDYRRFAIAVAAFLIILNLPVSEGMRDVAVEYSSGQTFVRNYYTHELFDVSYDEALQWQALTARALEACMLQGALGQPMVLKRGPKQLAAMGIDFPAQHYERYHALVEQMDPDTFKDLMTRASRLRYEDLDYGMLDQNQRRSRGAQHPRLSGPGGVRGDLLCDRGHTAARGGLLHRPGPRVLGHRLPCGRCLALLVGRLLVHHGQPHVRGRVRQNRRR
jgi:hypothetical protein